VLHKALGLLDHHFRNPHVARGRLSRAPGRDQ
jgi:hypothetical protein